MPYFYPGDTVTLGAGDLELSGVPITTGATVTVSIFNPNGTPFDEFDAPVIGNDWVGDINLPSTPGRYTVKITAVSNGATWHGKIDDLWIRNF